MSLYLEPPAHNPRGPDGQGWNRLSLNAHMGHGGPQCALRPTDYTTLYESQDTRRARYGGFGACTRGGVCEGCPVLNAPRRAPDSDEATVQARIETGGRRPKAFVLERSGWVRWGWAELAQLPDGWQVGRRLYPRPDGADGFDLVRPTAPFGAS